MDRVALVDRKIVDRQTDSKKQAWGLLYSSKQKVLQRGTPGHILAFSAEPMASLGPWLLHQ